MRHRIRARRSLPRTPIPLTTRLGAEETEALMGVNSTEGTLMLGLTCLLRLILSRQQDLPESLPLFPCQQ